MWAVLLPWTQRRSVASFMHKAPTFATAGSRGAPLPWEISRHAVAKFESARAFASDRALAVISDPTAAGAIRIHAVSLRQALSAVLQRHFDREFFARPFFPENFGQEVFEPLGFTREPLTQWLMRFEF